MRHAMKEKESEGKSLKKKGIQIDSAVYDQFAWICNAQNKQIKKEAEELIRDYNEKKAKDFEKVTVAEFFRRQNV